MAIPLLDDLHDITGWSLSLNPREPRGTHSHRKHAVQLAMQCKDLTVRVSARCTRRPEVFLDSRRRESSGVIVACAIEEIAKCLGRDRDERDADFDTRVLAQQSPCNVTYG